MTARPGAIAALHLATVAVYADMYVTQPILPLLSKEFGIAPASAGLTVSVVVLMIALVSSAYGSLSDRIGRKPVMVVSCALLAAQVPSGTTWPARVAASPSRPTA